MPREAYGPAAVKARDSLTDAAAQGDWRRALSQVRNGASAYGYLSAGFRATTANVVRRSRVV